MQFAFYIAKRYLFAKKSQNVINIITTVSMLGVAVGTMGLVIVLSVFNGFGDLVLSLYDSFDPDIKITAVQGKHFDPASIHLDEIKKTKGVVSVSQSLEENALLRYRDRQVIARIKGVDENFVRTTKLNSKIIDGTLTLKSGDTSFIVPGGGVAYYLGLNLQHVFSSINVFMPKAGAAQTLNPADAFNEAYIFPSGVFALQQDFDNKYALVPLIFAREIMGQPKAVSAIELQLKSDADVESVKQKIQSIAGANFEVKSRQEQHDFLYKILSTEKLVTYFILTLILIIATFTIIGSLTMLIIEKKHDINVLQSLGADNKMIEKIFLSEGLMITLIGAMAGLLLGFAICYIQQVTGFVKLGSSDDFVVDAYPVAIRVNDFIVSFFIVVGIGALASLYSVKKLLQTGSLTVAN